MSQENKTPPAEAKEANIEKAFNYAHAFKMVTIVVPLDVARKHIATLQADRDKLAGENAELRKRAKDVSQEEANALQDILRTLTNSGTALKTSARELVKRHDTLRAELEAVREELAREREDKQTAIELVNERGDKMKAALARAEAVRKERVSDVKPPDIMFAVYAREPGSDNWFEQETNTDEALVREWRDRNNERSPDLYDPPREYILVKKETTFTKLP